jgi:membrane protein
LKRVGSFLVQVVKDFLDDRCTQMAAAISYYAIFSLPPLIVLLILLLGRVIEAGSAEQLLSGQFGELLGPAGGEQVRSMIANATLPEGRGIATTAGVAAFLFGATGVFIQLQQALNTVWEVAPDPKRSGIGKLLVSRLISLAMIFALGFLLLASLAVSAVLSAFGDVIERYDPFGVSEAVLVLVNAVISFAVVGTLIAAIFKHVPDAVVRWRHALVGGVATALLFALGKFAFGQYLGRSDPGSVFGAAGSLAVVLLWIYYMTSIVLMGAEFTQVWASTRGAPIVPKKGAVRLEVKQVRREKAGGKEKEKVA